MVPRASGRRVTGSGKSPAPKAGREASARPKEYLLNPRLVFASKGRLLAVCVSIQFLTKSEAPYEQGIISDVH